MLAAGQLSVGGYSASALLENDLIRAPEEWMVILDTRSWCWIGGVHLSTSAVSNIFTGLCACWSKRFAFPENGLTLWPKEPLISLNSCPLWDGGAFFFISGASGGWHFNSGQALVKKENMKEQALFGSFSDWQYELGPPHIFPMYSVATRDYSLLLAIE